MGFGAMSFTKANTVYASVAEEHDHSSWQNWGNEDSEKTGLPSESGDYVLTSDISLSETWIVPEGTTKLCLNGYVINANGGNFNAIAIPTGATLDLYDCGTTVHNGYVDSTGLWHLGEGSRTAKTITGGIITGGNATTNGGGVNVSGTFNMYGGNIAGNTAQNGGGVSNIGSFTMTDGNIVGNTATTNGGGVYASSLIFVNILTGGTITENTAQNGGGVYYKVEECFAPGTLITMADGTRQAIETLNIGDSVRVFDHEKGEISSSKIFDVWTYPEKHSGVVKLYFSNNIDVTVVYGHSFFEHEQNKYVAVTRDNVSALVGHEFYNVDNERWETLEGYEFIDGEVDTYVITTEYQLNCVANGMLSNEDGFYSLLTNIFEYGDNLKIDQVKKEQDIATFGLYGYENIKHMSKHVYDILNFQYLKVAFGKGLITENEFNYLEAYYAEVDPELYCNGKEETPVESKSCLLKAPLKAPLLTSPVSAPTLGFYVGGSTKMLGNNGGNLYLSSGKTITIGTGTVGDGNGVVAPTEDMNIGITLADGIGKFTTNGTANYSTNFFSDSEDCTVRINDGGTDDNPSDDFLELVYVYVITNNTKEADKATNNGYIEVIETAIKDEEVSVAVYPNQGYKLSSLVFNDGTQDHDISSTKSFTMPEGAVSVTATFEEKGEQVITIVLDEKFIYPNTPYITEKQTYSTSNYYEKLGDGVVTIEYKPKGADDSEYTTEVPTEYGEYTLRVSVAEGSEYQAGFATKDFVYSPQIITQVGFGNLQQPVADAVVPEKTGGMLVNTKYTETLTWYPEISRVNEDGKKIFDCDTTYTATVTLTIKDSFTNNYVFADEPTLKGAGTGWVLSEDSTDKILIYKKEFEPTADHSVNKINGTNATCTEDGFEDAYQCETCGFYYEDETCSELIGDETAYNAWILGDGKISASGHDSSKVDGQSATCTEDGYKDAYFCEKCNKYFEDSACETLIGDSTAYESWKLSDGLIEATNHNFEFVEFIWDEFTAKAKYVCSNDSSHIDYHDATITSAVTTEPTCTTSGVRTYTATYDGHTDTKTEVIEATGHTYGKPTSSWNGNQVTLTVKCSCGDEQTQTFTGTYTKVTDATCTAKETGKYVVTIAEGIFAGTYESSVFETGNPLGHHTALVNGQDPTCTKDGYEDAYYCDDCGMYFENADGTGLIGDETAYNDWILGDGKISALGHSMTHHPAVAPTCTQDGNVEYWTCSHESGVYYANEQGTETLSTIVDPKLNHSITEAAGKLPTCTEDGYMVAYKCSTCEMYFTDPAGEHEIGDETAYNAWKLNEGKIQARHVDSRVSGVDPTKERSGYKEAWKCSECGQYFKDEACTILIGDETAYNAWKSAGGYLPQLPSEGLSAGAIAGICVGSIFLLLLVIYLIGYFFLYRKGKLDEKKIKVIYKILPRGEYNLKEDKK